MRPFTIVPPEPPKPLGVDEGREAAKAAFFKAKAAQMELVSHLSLTARLHNPGTVTYYKLKGMLAQAEEQAGRAQAVADLLRASIEAMEAVK